MNKGIRLFLIILLLVFSSIAQAASLGEVTFADSLTVQKRNLILNGLGMREATIFKVKVYVAGLYLESSTKNVESILNTSGSRVLQMHFTRDVSSEDVVKAWNDGLAKNCTESCETYQTKLSELVSKMSDLNSGDELLVRFDGQDSVELSSANKSLGKASAPGFATALLKIWIGANPPNTALKEGLLGLGRG